MRKKGSASEAETASDEVFGRSRTVQPFVGFRGNRASVTESRVHSILSLLSGAWDSTPRTWLRRKYELPRVLFGLKQAQVIENQRIETVAG